jgi:hypothetical protein
VKALATAALLLQAALFAPVSAAAEGPDVMYVPTSHRTVAAMLALGEVGPADVLYDLGSGDGRIPIAAAKQFGIRAVGIEIDANRMREAKDNAKAAGVTGLVDFRRQDLFRADLREATVVTLYLLPELNARLRPRLLAELRPGARIVSHAFDMGDWPPEKVVDVGDGDRIYLWRVPARPPSPGG